MKYLRLNTRQYLKKSRVVMFVFQSNAELAVRDMLREFAQRRRRQTSGSLDVESEDFMDDGTPIRLRVQINEEEVNSERSVRII